MFGRLSVDSVVRSATVHVRRRCIGLLRHGRSGSGRGSDGARREPKRSAGGCAASVVRPWSSAHSRGLTRLESVEPQPASRSVIRVPLAQVEGGGSRCAVSKKVLLVDE